MLSIQPLFCFSQAADGVAAVEGALRAPQHLDAVGEDRRLAGLDRGSGEDAV
jgi:hypothetical protein